MSRVEEFTEWMVHPTGMGHNHEDARSFAIKVIWRGPYRGRSGGGWEVSHHGSSLSRKGKWESAVPRFRRWQFRWESLADAQDVARKAVDSVRVNGKTWAQWQAHFDKEIS